MAWSLGGIGISWHLNQVGEPMIHSPWPEGKAAAQNKSYRVALKKFTGDTINVVHQPDEVSNFNLKRLTGNSTLNEGEGLDD